MTIPKSNLWYIAWNAIWKVVLYFLLLFQCHFLFGAIISMHSFWKKIMKLKLMVSLKCPVNRSWSLYFKGKQRLPKKLYFKNVLWITHNSRIMHREYQKAIVLLVPTNAFARGLRYHYYKMTLYDSRVPDKCSLAQFEAPTTKTFCCIFKSTYKNKPLYAQHASFELESR